MSEFYDFKATTIAGDTVSMQDYQNNVVLIVNTASKCGLTSQFEGLQKLHEQYADKGLTILGFPCNQFAAQDPASNDEIAAFCIKNYGVDFTMFEKVNVNGKDAHPIFVYLKDELGGTLGKQIKWNFTKFLLGRDGEAIKRFSPKTKPKDIERFIEEVLN